MIYKGRKVLDGSMRQIQNEHGRDVIHVRMESDAGNGVFESLPGVVQVQDFNNYKELRCNADADHQRILTTLMTRGRVEHFEIAHPSLADIFRRIARPGEDIKLTGGGDA
jgi:ABC-type uncharacterized transport system ATPase subunit